MKRDNEIRPLNDVPVDSVDADEDFNIVHEVDLDPTWQDVLLNFSTGMLVAIGVGCGLLVFVLVTLCSICWHYRRLKRQQEMKFLQAIVKKEELDKKAQSEALYELFGTEHLDPQLADLEAGTGTETLSLTSYLPGEEESSIPATFEPYDELDFPGEHKTYGSQSVDQVRRQSNRAPPLSQPSPPSEFLIPARMAFSQPSPAAGYSQYPEHTDTASRSPVAEESKSRRASNLPQPAQENALPSLTLPRASLKFVDFDDSVTERDTAGRNQESRLSRGLRSASLDPNLDSRRYSAAQSSPPPRSSGGSGIASRASSAQRSSLASQSLPLSRSSFAAQTSQEKRSSLAPRLSLATGSSLSPRQSLAAHLDGESGLPIKMSFDENAKNRINDWRANVASQTSAFPRNPRQKQTAQYEVSMGGLQQFPNNPAADSGWPEIDDKARKSLAVARESGEKSKTGDNLRKDSTRHNTLQKRSSTNASSKTMYDSFKEIQARNRDSLSVNVEELGSNDKKQYSENKESTGKINRSHSVPEQLDTRLNPGWSYSRENRNSKRCPKHATEARKRADSPDEHFRASRYNDSSDTGEEGSRPRSPYFYLNEQKVDKALNKYGQRPISYSNLPFPKDPGRQSSQSSVQSASRQTTVKGGHEREEDYKRLPEGKVAELRRCYSDESRGLSKLPLPQYPYYPCTPPPSPPRKRKPSRSEWGYRGQQEWSSLSPSYAKEQAPYRAKDVSPQESDEEQMSEKRVSDLRRTYSDESKKYKKLPFPEYPYYPCSRSPSPQKTRPQEAAPDVVRSESRKEQPLTAEKRIFELRRKFSDESKKYRKLPFPEYPYYPCSRSPSPQKSRPREIRPQETEPVLVRSESRKEQPLIPEKGIFELRRKFSDESKKYQKLPFPEYPYYPCSRSPSPQKSRPRETRPQEAEPVLVRSETRKEQPLIPEKGIFELRRKFSDESKKYQKLPFPEYPYYPCSRSPSPQKSRPRETRPQEAEPDLVRSESRKEQPQTSESGVFELRRKFSDESKKYQKLPFPEYPYYPCSRSPSPRRRENVPLEIKPAVVHSDSDKEKPPTSERSVSELRRTYSDESRKYKRLPFPEYPYYPCSPPPSPKKKKTIPAETELIIVHPEADEKQPIENRVHGLRRTFSDESKKYTKLPFPEYPYYPYLPPTSYPMTENIFSATGRKMTELLEDVAGPCYSEWNYTRPLERKVSGLRRAYSNESKNFDKLPFPEYPYYPSSRSTSPPSPSPSFKRRLVDVHSPDGSEWNYKHPPGGKVSELREAFTNLVKNKKRPAFPKFTRYPGNRPPSPSARRQEQEDRAASPDQGDSKWDYSYSPEGKVSDLRKSFDHQSKRFKTVSGPARLYYGGRPPPSPSARRQDDRAVSHVQGDSKRDYSHPPEGKVSDLRKSFDHQSKRIKTVSGPARLHYGGRSPPSSSARRQDDRAASHVQGDSKWDYKHPSEKKMPDLRRSFDHKSKIFKTLSVPELLYYGGSPPPSPSANRQDDYAAIPVQGDSKWDYKHPPEKKVSDWRKSFDHQLNRFKTLSIPEFLYYGGRPPPSSSAQRQEDRAESPVQDDSKWDYKHPPEKKVSDLRRSFDQQSKSFKTVSLPELLYYGGNPPPSPSAQRQDDRVASPVQSNSKWDYKHPPEKKVSDLRRSFDQQSKIFQTLSVPKLPYYGGSPPHSPSAQGQEDRAESPVQDDSKLDYKHPPEKKVSDLRRSFDQQSKRFQTLSVPKRPYYGDSPPHSPSAQGQEDRAESPVQDDSKWDYKHPSEKKVSDLRRSFDQQSKRFRTLPVPEHTRYRQPSSSSPTKTNLQYRYRYNRKSSWYRNYINSLRKPSSAVDPPQTSPTQSQTEPETHPELSDSNQNSAEHLFEERAKGRQIKFSSQLKSSKRAGLGTNRAYYLRPPSVCHIRRKSTKANQGFVTSDSQRDYSELPTGNVTELRKTFSYQSKKFKQLPLPHYPYYPHPHPGFSQQKHGPHGHGEYSDIQRLQERPVSHYCRPFQVPAKHTQVKEQQQPLHGYPCPSHGEGHRYSRRPSAREKYKLGSKFTKEFDRKPVRNVYPAIPSPEIACEERSPYANSNESSLIHKDKGLIRRVCRSSGKNFHGPRVYRKLTKYSTERTRKPETYYQPEYLEFESEWDYKDPPEMKVTALRKHFTKRLKQYQKTPLTKRKSKRSFITSSTKRQGVKDSVALSKYRSQEMPRGRKSSTDDFWLKMEEERPAKDIVASIRNQFSRKGLKLTGRLAPAPAETSHLARKLLYDEESCKANTKITKRRRSELEGLLAHAFKQSRDSDNKAHRQQLTADSVEPGRQFASRAKYSASGKLSRESGVTRKTQKRGKSKEPAVSRRRSYDNQSDISSEHSDESDDGAFLWSQQFGD